MTQFEFDSSMIHRAWQLAECGLLAVEPNPCVGAVVVVGDRIVGEGWHQRYGGAHAEVNAIAAAGESARGATLYVSLEPCSTTGKTPPCVDAIVSAGIARVVYSVGDPDPRNANRARDALERAGIIVVGPLASESQKARLDRFVRHLDRKRPWIIAKWAMSLDGRIATRSGDSKWISNDASRRWVHDLRGHVDAIGVGVGTVEADRPALTARPPGPLRARRVVFDRRCVTPLDWVALRDGQSQVIVSCAADSDPSRRDSLASLGARVLAVDGTSRREHLSNTLRVLYEEGVRRLLIEGGQHLLGTLFDLKQVDQVATFVAPRVIGGLQSRTPVGGDGVDWLRDATSLRNVVVQTLHGTDSSDPDVLVEGYCDAI